MTRANASAPDRYSRHDQGSRQYSRAPEPHGFTNLERTGTAAGSHAQRPL